jgi:hypothetical protein
MKKKSHELQLMMVYLHSMQTQVWSETILDTAKVIHEFKYLLNNLKNSSKLFNKYCEKVMNTDDYETSAEISDSLYRMAQLPDDKITELSKIMNEYLDKHLTE